MEEKTVEKLAEISKELEKAISPVEHHCDDQNCSDSSHTSSRGESAPQAFKKSIAEAEEEQQQPTISIKDIKALKRSNYSKIADKFQFAYVIKNKKTGLVVEIRAASSVHACNIIGWRPKQVKLIEIIDTKKKENAANAVSISTTSEENSVESEIFTNAISAEVPKTI